MRLFIAIVPNAEAKQELAEFQKTLKACSTGGLFVPPENFHVTVRFLGECNELGPVAESMRQSVRGLRPFALRLAGYGSFARGEGRLAYASLSGDLLELNRLHQTLEAALESAGLGREKRPLKPHITLGRNVRTELEAEESLRAVVLSQRFTAEELVLFESVRERGTLVYHPLHRVRI